MSAAPFTDTTATSRSTAGGSTRSLGAGRILSGIAVLFLTFDLSIKLAGAKEAVDGTVKLGWQPHHLPILGGLQLVCLVLYLIPRTAPLGAVLWTGYLGGAVATHLRVDDPLFSRIL